MMRASECEQAHESYYQMRGTNLFARDRGTKGKTTRVPNYRDGGQMWRSGICCQGELGSEVPTVDSHSRPRDSIVVSIRSTRHVHSAKGDIRVHVGELQGLASHVERWVSVQQRELGNSNSIHPSSISNSLSSISPSKPVAA